MSTTCVAPTFSYETAEYAIADPTIPPCIPDVTTTLQTITTEVGTDLLTEDGLPLLFEGE